VNGLGNVFHRKRESGIEWSPGKPVIKGKTNVFIMDWSDHPEKTQAWFDERESKAIDDGLLHVFQQEVCRNYAASVEGVVIPAIWVKSAIDAHIKLKFEEHANDDVYAGLDVADGGGDRNALAVRKGVVLLSVDQWGERDTGVTARKAVAGVEGHKRVLVQYDCIGVGSGVKAESNRLKDDNLLPKGIEFISWDAGAKPLDPDKHVVINDDGTEDEESPINKDFYSNLKAQGWWCLRRRFEKTHRAVTEGVKFDQDELISLPSDLPQLRTLQKELSQPTAGKDTRMRLKINKQPDGTRSPNLGDGVMMAYHPVENTTYDSSMEWV
jgi:phage terminase large subunit